MLQFCIIYCNWIISINELKLNVELETKVFFFFLTLEDEQEVMGLLELSPRSKVGTILQQLKGAMEQLNKVEFMMTFIAFYLFNMLRTQSFAGKAI